MVYNYLVFYKENHDYITIEHDYFNQSIDIYYNKNKIFTIQFKKRKIKETFHFEYLENHYQLFVNTKHFLFLKKDKFILFENGNAFKKSKFKSKTWDVSTKKADYHIHVLYNDFTSSMKVCINENIVYDSLDKVKAFEPSIRKIDYDNQVFRFIKKKVENELFSLTLKMNSREAIYCKEDLLFIDFYAKLKRNSRKIKLHTYLLEKWLEILILPLFLFGLFCLHLYLIAKAQFVSASKEVLTLITFLGVSFSLVIIMYIVSFIFYKKRFKN